MAITYPLSFPATPKHSSIRWIESNNIAIATSSYTLQRQTYDYGIGAWAIDVSIDPLTRAEAAPWMAFLSALRGQLGTFLYGDELCKEPQGAGGGTPRVKGNGQSGFALITDGWPNNTLVLKAGDYIQIDQRLYRVLTDSTSNGSGEVTLDIWPHLKVHADNTLLVLSSPKGLFRLDSNTITTQNTNRTQLYDISFSAVEAL